MEITHNYYQDKINKNNQKNLLHLKHVITISQIGRIEVKCNYRKYFLIKKLRKKKILKILSVVTLNNANIQLGTELSFFSTRSYNIIHVKLHY